MAQTEFNRRAALDHLCDDTDTSTCESDQAALRDICPLAGAQRETVVPVAIGERLWNDSSRSMLLSSSTTPLATSGPDRPTCPALFSVGSP